MNLSGNLRTTSLLVLASLCQVPFQAEAQDGTAGTTQSPDVTMTWVEKYLTYEQNQEGQLHLTDVHFLAEIIFDSERDFDAISATLYRGDTMDSLADYGGKDKRAFTNGYFYTRKTRSFDDLASLETVHSPTQTYVWEIEGPNGHFTLDPVRIGGPEGKTQIPPVSTIRLHQNGAPVDNVMELDADLPLVVSWDPFSIGATLEGTEWDDLIFVLVSDCRGDVVYTGGAPGTDEDFVDFNDTSATVPAMTLKPGNDYVVFISQVNYVDHNQSHGITQLTANSFATELKVKTSGQGTTADCPSPPRPAQYLWTRKTQGDGMESWPTLVDHW